LRAASICKRPTLIRRDHLVDHLRDARHALGKRDLKVPARTTDTAKAAVFLAYDRARMMTGTVLNATAGSAAD
jgi:hypothetical protein